MILLRALNRLKQGNRRFLNGTPLIRDYLGEVKKNSGGQNPFAVILSCMDSRVPVNIVFDLGFGEVFALRVAGNVINEDILGSLEYACSVVGTKMLVVLGHTGCGAIKAATDNLKLGHLTGLLSKIEPATQSAKKLLGENADIQSPEFLYKVTERNVINTMEEIHKQSPIIEKIYMERKMGIVGGIYDVETGKVKFFVHKHPRKIQEEALLKKQKKSSKIPSPSSG